MQISRPTKFLAGFLVRADPSDPPWFFDAQESWVPRNMPVREHAVPCFEFHAQIQGGTGWRMQGKELQLRAGQAILIPPGVRHHLVEFTKEQSHHFTAGLLPEKMTPPISGIHTDLWKKEPVIFPVSASMQEAIHLFVRELSSASALKTEAMEAAVRFLFIEIDRAVTRGDCTSSKVFSPALVRAQQLIDEHPAADWRLEYLARAVRISPRHLFGLFKTELRETPHAYHLRKRVELACRLLRDSDVSITDIAFDCGFSSSQNFATVFRRHTGTSPSGFRKRNKP